MLPDRIRTIVEAVAAHLPRDESAALHEQIRSATASGEVAGRRVDITLSADAPALPVPDGPLRLAAAVTENGTVTGEVLIWMTSGKLSGLERTWYTDEAPTTWPPVSDLEFA